MYLELKNCTSKLTILYNMSLIEKCMILLFKKKSTIKNDTNFVMIKLMNLDEKQLNYSLLNYFFKAIDIIYK